MAKKTISKGDRVKIKIGGSASGGGLQGRKGTVLSIVDGFLYRVKTDDGLLDVDGYYTIKDIERINEDDK